MLRQFFLTTRSLQQSDFTFTEIWDPMDTIDASLDTAYGASTLCKWRITWTDGTNSAEAEFDGFILGLAPTTVGADGVQEREVTVTRVGGITYATPV